MKERKSRGLRAGFRFINKAVNPESRLFCTNCQTADIVTQMITSAKKIMMLTRRHEFFVFRRRFRCRLFCERCALETEFLSLDDAVLFSGLTTRQTVRLVEAGEIHFLETVGGHLFVCRPALEKSAESIV